MRNLIKEIKESGQDFEFYPTTKEIVQGVYDDLAIKERYGKSYSILDVGCGNGGFFTKFDIIREEVSEYHKLNNIDESQYNFCDNKKAKPIANLGNEFAIEKSEILINNLPSHIVVVGTDFWENTLIDKKVDIIFSNPPYSEFEEWSSKIIREAYCNTIYLVIPERWKNSKDIDGALRMRKFEAKILGSFDFLDAERTARAKVNLVKISPAKIKISDRYYDKTSIADPFDVWFEQEFKVDLNKEDDSWSVRNAKEEKDREKRQKEIKNEIAIGRDLTEVLVNLYQKDMARLLDNYKKVAELDGELLKELGVKLENIKSGLKEKISGLKSKYWHEFFNNFDKIKNRLTTKKRDTLLAKLHSKTSVDFTESNIYAIVIWVIKNANQYFEEQIKEVYLELTKTEYVKKYKSNNRTWENDRWRYKNEGSNTHYCLDYRIITRNYRDIIINDVKTIAHNLGFYDIGDVKTFQNGNVHFRFQKDFIKAFNIEAARLFGWIKSPQEAVDEFVGDCQVTEQEAEKYFRGNFLITETNKQLLLN